MKNVKTPKLTRLKPEENQPPLEAYFSDLIITPTPTSTPTPDIQPVTPVNTEDHTTTTVNETVQCPKEDTK